MTSIAAPVPVTSTSTSASTSSSNKPTIVARNTTKNNDESKTTSTTSTPSPVNSTSTSTSTNSISKPTVAVTPIDSLSVAATSASSSSTSTSEPTTATSSTSTPATSSTCSKPTITVSSTSTCTSTSTSSSKPTWNSIAALLAATASVSAALSSNSNDNNNKDAETMETMPWEEEGWAPRTATGKIKTPSMIRDALQKYIEVSDKSQNYIIHNELEVNNNSFRRFMNPDTYKNQWSATQNGTYWAAAKLLEKHAYEQNQGKTKNKDTTATTTTTTAAATKKRKTIHTSNNSTNNKMPTTTTTATTKKRRIIKPTRTTKTSQDMEAYMQKVQAISLAPEGIDKVYDSCPEVIHKIREFLQRDGVSKAAFCRILDDLNHNSLNRFLATKQQEGAGMVAYERAYKFFERMRILEQTPKSQRRLLNEISHSNGFALKGPTKGRPPYMLFAAI